MKKFKFTIQGNNYEVDILNIEDNIAEIEVNGSAYKVEIQHELKTVKTPKLVRRIVEPSHESDRAKTYKPADKISAGSIKAPLPGIILKVKVQLGNEVKIGDTLLIMEAMKMENNINTNRAGFVTSIKVKEGDSVMEGDVLIEIGDK